MATIYTDISAYDCVRQRSWDNGHSIKMEMIEKSCDWNWDNIKPSASFLWQDWATQLTFDRIVVDKPSADERRQPNVNMTCRSVFPPKYVPFMEPERVCRHCVRCSLFKDVIDVECDHCSRTCEELEDELPILECGCDECCEAYQQSEAEADAEAEELTDYFKQLKDAEAEELADYFKQLKAAEAKPSDYFKELKDAESREIRAARAKQECYRVKCMAL